MIQIKKAKTIKGFTFILSIGTIISFIGKIPFRFIPLIILTGNDYSIFSLTLQTFALTITVAGLTLHSPLTREIRLNENSNEVESNFALSYWITNLVGFIFMFTIGFIYLKVFSILQLLLFSVSIIFRSFMEFFIAITRARGDSVRCALITSIPAIIDGLILIPFIFNIQIFLNLYFFLYLYCFGLLFSFIIGAILSKSSWKILFLSLQNLYKKDYLLKAINNIKKGLLLSVNTLFHSLGNWLVIFLASNIMTPNSFKILDLSLFSISFIALFSSNLLISVLSVSNIKDKPKKNKGIILFLIVGTITMLILFIILDFIPLELILDEFFNLYFPTEGKNIIRVTILLIFSMFLIAFLGGKIHTLGKYKKIAFSSFFSFLGLLLFLFLGFFTNSGVLLIFGLFILNLIEGILYYYFIYYT